MNKRYISMLSLVAALSVSAATPADSIAVGAITGLSKDQPVDIGGDRTFTREESTGAVSVITTDHLNRRSAKNIGNSILGEGSGLISLQGAGSYAAQNPTFYIRGLQTLNGNTTPLFIVDGVERDINLISPEEVESVSILKDAVATALYGYKGINGVVVVTTKRGSYNSKEITFTYDHVFNSVAHRPKMVDAYTYASAMNEARANDGLSAMYNANELNAFRTGNYPYLYPNVNWLDETFNNHGAANKYNVQFRGGTDKFRYYAMLDLLTDNGFIKRPNQNEGYSTQDKFSRGNMRMNLDIDLTPTTLVSVNVLGAIAETRQPGEQADLWSMVYNVPAAAFPIKAADGKWGSSNTWKGTSNPVAEAEGAGYYKNHQRLLQSDLTIRQDLSAITKGLSANIRVAYDNIANIYENHSKTFIYNTVTPSWPEGQAEPTFTSAIEGADSELGSDAKTNTYNRRFHFDGGFNYDRTFGDFGVYSQLKWDYEYVDPEGSNNTIYRQDITWWSHLNYKQRYLLDLTLVESGTNRLAPGSKWSFSPTVGLGWVISNESFWSNPASYLKLRATFGKINADFLPDGNWTYYAQQYTTAGGTYPFHPSWSSDFGRTSLGRMATQHLGHEYAYKYNVGIDASPIAGLDLSLDLWKERRSGIWVETGGKYSAVLGMDAPYENDGIVDSKGFEFSADYTKSFGDFTFNVGGNVSYNINEIVEMDEEPRLYSNLVQTGHSVGQLYGLEAIGFFTSEADIANSPKQNFSTVRVGDIKYRDINGDGVIDNNDKTAIGHSSTCPNLYYNFRLGAEYKGFGVYAFFQGTGRYTAYLNTTSMYWPLINNTNISQYAYDNRWTPENQDALFPALSSQSNANNYQASTLWLRDRSFLKLRNLEVYYNLPKPWLNSTLKVVNAAKVYVRAIDLFCAGSDVPENDPEAYGISRLNKSFAVGLSVTF
ncbi:MAG: SusC/RagA family TonB-linked outer membrane protein [Muribaculaceae bacterium]